LPKILSIFNYKNLKMQSFKTTISTKIKQKLGIISYSVGRKLTVFEDDIFLVSYPKSGNTWARFLISNLLYPDIEIDFASIQKLIPDIYLSSDKEILQVSRPRIIKSHEYFDPRYKKVIFIVRDPRDVAVSNYFHLLKYSLNNDETSLSQFTENFLRGVYYPVREINPIGSWGENTGSWLGAKKGGANLLFLRYEDFKINPTRQLHKIANFLSLSVSESDISNAIKNSSIERMRELELKQKDVWPNKYTKKNIAFVRRASSGEGQNKLSESTLKQIESCWGEIMQELGYL